MTETLPTMVCRHPNLGLLIKRHDSHHFHRLEQATMPGNVTNVDPVDVPNADLLAIEVYDMQKKRQYVDAYR